jgi:Putative esterase
MAKARATVSAVRASWPVRLLVACCLLALIPAFPQRAAAAVPASDDFNRPAGGLGPDWASISDGALSISSHAVTSKGGLAGDVWTAGTFTSDQYSQIEITSRPLTGGEWIGAAVRAQHGGRDAYTGVYYWNAGQPELLLFKRSGGGWTELGSYRSGPLAAGTQLKLVAVGGTISLLENDLVRITVSDRSLAGGAPGIMIYGAGAVGSWSGGDASATVGSQIHYMSTDPQGVRSYQVISPYDGPGPQLLRVLAPTHPAPGVPHNFLYVLPVQAQLGNTYSDGLETLRRLDAQDRYNLTIIEPTFAIDPWYADNPENPDVRYETFMTKVIVPWAEKNLAITGREQNWLIGFSKSGLGAMDLILKHPGIFALAAAWDFPANMSSYDQLGADPAASYGTNANFQAGYRLTPAFVQARSRPFLRLNRIWIGGNREFPVAMADYAKLLAEEGIVFSREAPRFMYHTWDSGWVPDALVALRRDSMEFSWDKVYPPPVDHTPSQYAWSMRWLYK